MTNFDGTALRLCIMALALFVAACAQTTTVEQANGAFHDPYENTNRSVHSFNLGVDKYLFRPASKGYVKIIPDPMVTSFNSFAENISLPGQAVDYLLQGKPKESGIALYRFLINSTVGFAGLADPATDFKVPQVDTDFGETLHVWGVGEGPYLELPLYGPSTTRDAVGVVVNLFTNPLDFAPTRPVDNLGLYTEFVRRMGDRGRFSDTVDSILYESADSYAQARLIYLQNRRFELASDDEDAYLGLYADPYSDASDPYEDPYAE